jgi:hypothetical protein
VDADGYWDDPANWDTGSVPGYNDDVCIDRPAGAFTITVRQSAGTVGSVQSAETLRIITNGLLKVHNPSSFNNGMKLEGGTLGTQSYATLTISGNSLWTDGTLTGNGIITNTGTLTMTNPVTRTLSTRLDNTGTIVQSDSGNLKINSGKQVNNLAGALYDFQGDGDIIGSGQFNNSGTLRKSAGSGESRFSSNTHLNNLGGTVEVQSGQLTWGQGSSTGGTFNVSAGAVLDLTGGSNYTAYEGTYTGSGDGRIQISSGKFNTTGSGVTFNFPEGLLRWSGGTINTYGTVFTNLGTIVITGTVGVGRGEFRNFGTVRHQGSGSLNLNGDAWGVAGTFVNEAGALYDLKNDADVLGGTFINAGTLRKSGGSGESSFGNTFDNQNGTIDVQVGTINLAGSGTSTGGNFNVEAGAVLEISRDLVSNGVQDWTGLYTGSGAGTVRHRGHLRGDNDDPPVLNFPQGMFQWTGGFIYGGTLINEGYLQLCGDEDKYFRAHIINRGTVVHTGNGNLRHRIDAQFDNEGLYDLQSDADILQWEDQYTGSAPFYNSGVFRKSGGSGISEFEKTTTDRSTVFSNTGTVEVLAGTLSIARRDVPVQGGVLTDGTWKVAPFATLTFPNAGDVATNQATVILEGPTSQFPNLGTLAHNEGSFTITDGHDFATSGDFTNSGTLTVGPDSTLTVNGTYTEASSNSFTIQIGGSPASSQYGQVNVSGQAALTGTLHVELVNGFGPTQGDSYTIMSFAGRNGNFTKITGLYPFFEATVSDATITLNTLFTARDLAVDAASITLPATADPGTEVTINYTVNNLSDSPVAGDWYDSIYLSTDTTYDPGDSLIGRIHHTGGVGALSSYNEALTAPLPGVVDGDYQAIVIADSRGLVPDTNRNNNVASSSDTISVTVAVLPYDTPLTVSIGEDEDRYYRLDVSGEQYVVISATFDTVLHAEFFASVGKLPTRSDYDYVAAGLYDLKREITLPKYINGAYYLYLHGREGAGAGRPVILQAREVPLALYQVAPTQIGNQGQATLRLVGLNFTDTMDVTLVQGSTTIPASSLEVQDFQTAFATFDLGGVATGSYTVRLHNGVEATLPNAVQVRAEDKADVWLNLVGPGHLRPGRTFEFTLEYGNRGGADAPAPWITVGVNDGLTWRIKGGREIEARHFDLLAISPDGPPDVLRPGQRNRITFQATSRGVPPYIQAWTADPMQRLDAETIVRHFGGDPERTPWDGIVVTLDAQLGTTQASYLDTLRRLARERAAVGNREYSVDALLQGAVVDLLIEQIVTSASITSNISDRCESRSYDTHFNGSGSRLPDGRWVPFPSPREPTYLEMVEYRGDVNIRKYAVAVLFGLREEWLQWIELWQQGTGDPWVGTFDSRIAREMLKHLMTPQKFGVVQIDTLSLWEDINTRIAFQIAPFGDVPFGDAAFDFETTHKDPVTFSNYIFPKPGEVKWAFGGDYLHYPMTPGGNWTAVHVETERRSLNPAGDIVYWTVHDMPMRVIDEFDLDEHVVNEKARLSSGADAYEKGDPTWFYIPFYMLQTFGNARCMKWIVNLVLPEYSGKAILAGVEADAGGDRTVKLPKGQTYVNVTLHGSAKKLIKTRLATGADGAEPYDWGGFPVTPSDEQNPTMRLSEGTYVFTLNVNAFGAQKPYLNQAYTDFDSVTVRVVKEECHEGDPDCAPSDELHLSFVIAGDPNDIVGPAGVGNDHFVTDAETFPYTILFENKPEATAPAQEVAITHSLSSDLDWSTFELGSFGFSGRSFDIPSGRSYYRTRLDLVDELGFYLDVEAGINLQTGVASWTFRTIDPQTGDLVSDPLAGFLPPNKVAPEGEGFVNFTVQPRTGLNTGTAINAQATIVFDFNAPINTPVYTNTLDVDAPTSSVDPLPASTTSVFPVSWSGDDGTGSGVALYQVYVSDDGGPFTAWQN